MSRIQVPKSAKNLFLRHDMAQGEKIRELWEEKRGAGRKGEKKKPKLPCYEKSTLVIKDPPFGPGLVVHAFNPRKALVQLEGIEGT